ncbi:benzoate-CoA ligase [Pseudosulfitobacter pseudonitzschiae]|uniref:4-hydroxybenzoate--CoA ligase n=1 Tax=Pseudosulfitobacter pseudonitzschiae TaxID=1402135 RepID=A0A073JBF5_9RHOB|nr:benzoate-CoA ligase family protein [Pseudosulfitobacter pseudonitzschiae]KEJ95037.1 4-hydroxybenzoate--CoA ligase [Pseudosulfitobacter pseudonitzschiae]QKS07559.1 benzoate-CoA ligase family protein [Pseudosulfitobacter pseudonitzschiae]SHF17861.1 benzoate-CoA ligase [Pseudosulfitobacter pseudonitzschiae]
MSSLASANAASYFVDRHVEEGRGDKVAFREYGSGRSLTYGALADASGRVATAFAAHGVVPEQRVAMLVLDTIEFPQIFWGALKAGVIPVPLNTLLATSVYDAILRDSRATTLFVSDVLYDTVAPALADNPFVKTVVVIGGAAPDGTISYQTFLDTADAPTVAFDANADEVAFWLYSSGSTGQPKGVHHIHSSLKATADTYGAQVLGVREDDVVFSAAKFFFAYGLGNAMTFPMAVGATTVLFAGRPTPDSVVDILNTEQPTVFCGVPTLYAALVAYMDKNGAASAPLRRCISAGEALPEDVGTRWEKHTGVEILDGVGSTEMLHIFLSNRPGDVVYGTSGVAVPGYAVRLVDEAGQDVATGEVGELLVQGDSAASCYWNQRAKTRTTFEGTWTRTGDKYECRDDGRFVYCGRTDDMFKVSGIWVSPFEVESAIISHADVLEAAVVAARDDDGLEKPKAFVVLNAGVSPDGIEAALKEHVKTKIGKWKYPRWIACVDELPKTATGKIQRFKLREDA